MSEFDQDVLIAGGGMVGATLALALGRFAPHLRVEVIEAFPLPAAQGQGYQPSFDMRSTALSLGSLQLLSELGLTSLERHAGRIEQVQVCSRQRPGSLRLDAGSLAWPCLGQVVENAWLGRQLLEAVAQCASVTWCCPAQVVSAQAIVGGYQVELETGDGRRQQRRTRLLVVADGADSALCRRLGVGLKRRDFHSQALITNVTLDRPHQAIAYERFTEQGPMALLPQGDSPEGEPRMALVWTLPSALAEQYRALPEAEFLQRLQQAFGYRAGLFNRLGSRHTYPLAQLTVREQVRPHLLIAGNAAHLLHPVAGQGFNLCLRDLAALVARLRHWQEGPPPLQGYLSEQLPDQRRTAGISRTLATWFDGGWLAAASPLGLWLSAASPDLKRWLAHQLGGRLAGQRQQWS